jgi:hypothetical protein
LLAVDDEIFSEETDLELGLERGRIWYFESSRVLGCGDQVVVSQAPGNPAFVGHHREYRLLGKDSVVGGESMGPENEQDCKSLSIL